MKPDTQQDSPTLQPKDRFMIDATSPSGLRWKTNGHGYKRGDVAGSKTPKGYWKVGKQPNKKMVHRVVYEIAFGPIDADFEIDHADGNPSNNHPSNLRACSHGENGQNKFGSASQDWYPKGININARTGLVQGIIGIDGKQVRPGKGFREDRDVSSNGLNTLVSIMRKALEDMHGPYANTQSYYCQLPDEAVLGRDEGF
ncbi:HNH endonuclease [Pseudomonas petrae]|uniref:HNH endonuclease n=1 Tax=Pseudomonas petrae TaxID=2912190 RepID=UPI001EF0147A|nr:HNH endonuclease [Pseudomonas petrae]MCF7532766.1 HNH endonuclease [Pseudomonas petrae]MCF7557139.1 HNH endonuclease [Pseudomonas petrae]